MVSVELASYAKINLTLEVADRREDGYHDLDSVVQIIDIRDELSICKADPGVIEVDVDTPGIPSGKDNTIYKACELFFQTTGIRSGVKCMLRKKIPAQAGLGGGSGNAAAAIVGLNYLYQSGLYMAELSGIAAKVGSDVPLFIYGGTVRMRGRGEMIEPLPDAPELYLVVLKPVNVGVPTGWAYCELDKKPSHGYECVSERAELAIRQVNRMGLIDAMCNDFDPVVSQAYDEVQQAKDMLTSRGALKVMLAGSGSAVFGVFGSYLEAHAAVESFSCKGCEVFLAQSLKRHESSWLGLVNGQG